MGASSASEVSKQDFSMLINNGTLKLTSVASENAGQYECSADNGIGSPIQANFTILIRGI